MPDIKNRIKIARSFGLASKSYDVSARLQRYSGKHLMPWLPNRNDLTVLDLGAGTGFFTHILAGSYQQVIGVDISHQMVEFAKAHRSTEISWLRADAFKLPLQTASIDFIYSNLVIQWCEPLDKVLDEILRVLKPGGRLLVLEFSKPEVPGLAPVYDFYSFNILPKIGKIVADDEDSYRYLAESIRMHPDQETLKGMMENVGFENTFYQIKYSIFEKKSQSRSTSQDLSNDVLSK